MKMRIIAFILFIYLFFSFFIYFIPISVYFISSNENVFVFYDFSFSLTIITLHFICKTDWLKKKNTHSCMISDQGY